MRILNQRLVRRVADALAVAQTVKRAQAKCVEPVVRCGRVMMARLARVPVLAVSIWPCVVEVKEAE